MVFFSVSASNSPDQVPSKQGQTSALWFCSFGSHLAGPLQSNMGCQEETPLQAVFVAVLHVKTKQGSPALTRFSCFRFRQVKSSGGPLVWTQRSGFVQAGLIIVTVSGVCQSQKWGLFPQPTTWRQAKGSPKSSAGCAGRGRLRHLLGHGEVPEAQAETGRLLGRCPLDSNPFGFWGRALLSVHPKKGCPFSTEGNNPIRSLKRNHLLGSAKGSSIRSLKRNLFVG